MLKGRITHEMATRFYFLEDKSRLWQEEDTPPPKKKQKTGCNLWGVADVRCLSTIKLVPLKEADIFCFYSAMAGDCFGVTLVDTGAAGRLTGSAKAGTFKAGVAAGCTELCRSLEFQVL